jgi:hypothetical protein
MVTMSLRELLRPYPHCRHSKGGSCLHPHSSGLSFFQASLAHKAFSELGGQDWFPISPDKP